MHTDTVSPRMEFGIDLMNGSKTSRYENVYPLKKLLVKLNKIIFGDVKVGQLKFD